MNKATIVTIFIILVCLLVGTKSWAEECLDKGSQTDMNICATDVAKKVDLELEAVYKKLKKIISPEGQAKLLEAHEAWKEYRKKQCEFETLGSAGGTIHSTVLAYCYVALQRI